MTTGRINQVAAFPATQLCTKTDWAPAERRAQCRRTALELIHRQVSIAMREAIRRSSWSLAEASFLESHLNHPQARPSVLEAALTGASNALIQQGAPARAAVTPAGPRRSIGGPRGLPSGSQAGLAGWFRLRLHIV